MKTKNNQLDRMRAYRSGILTPERGGEYWDKDERDKLRRCFQDGLEISELSLEFQRSESGIVNQLLQMGLLTPPGAGRQRKSKTPACLCERCAYRNTCQQKGDCKGRADHVGTRG